MGLLDALSMWLSGGRREATVVVLGLDNSGKSSLLRALAPPPPPPPPLLPTVGTTREHFTSNGVSFSALDVGGSRRHRALWERTYRAADAIIYVVDAADHLRLVVAREELELVLEHPDVRSKRGPLLVLANKSDRPGALPPAQLAAALGLERVLSRPWHVCATTATSGVGLAPAVQWLAAQLRAQASPPPDAR